MFYIYKKLLLQNGATLIKEHYYKGDVQYKTEIIHMETKYSDV